MMETYESDDTEISFFWIIFIFFFGLWLFNKHNAKEYDSSVYSSWEEERIDELEGQVDYLMNKLEPN